MGHCSGRWVSGLAIGHSTQQRTGSHIGSCPDESQTQLSACCPLLTQATVVSCLQSFCLQLEERLGEPRSAHVFSTEKQRVVAFPESAGALACLASLVRSRLCLLLCTMLGCLPLLSSQFSLDLSTVAGLLCFGSQLQSHLLPEVLAGGWLPVAFGSVFALCSDNRAHPSLHLSTPSPGWSYSPQGLWILAWEKP